MGTIGLAFLLAIGIHCNPAFAQDRALPSIAIDRDTGGVLVEHRAFDRWYPASLTKLMTVYVALQAVARGELQPGSPVVISANAARQPPSKMGYSVGARLRIDTAIRILIVKSANDVAVALAEAVAGTQSAFVARMNEAARELDMRDSRFANPHGLHDPAQYVSARDMALLAREILIRFPEWASEFAIPAISSGQTVHHTYNLLLERFPGADGMKTGFVCASGYNMVATATRGQRQVISVVLGAFSQTERAVTAAALLTEGFEREPGLNISEYRAFEPPSEAQSQRGRMCSEKARQERYDPGAGLARIDHELLTERQVSRAPVPVSTGGIDAPPSEAFLFASLLPQGRVPVPSPRPEFSRRDIDGADLRGRVAEPRRIPVPVPRPDR